LVCSEEIKGSALFVAPHPIFVELLAQVPIPGVVVVLVQRSSIEFMPEIDTISLPRRKGCVRLDSDIDDCFRLCKDALLKLTSN
jgi:hypothetical protein